MAGKNIKVVWSRKQKYKDLCIDDCSSVTKNGLPEIEKDGYPPRAGGSP